jgi:three-Cys-motif partner protein
MVNDNLYEGREQTRVKHDILRHYLESLAHVIGFAWPSITYIDGFSGPWNSRSHELTDTSFAIAIRELLRARDTHRTLGREVRIRCVFVERDQTAFEKLREFTDTITEADILPIHGEFENVIDQIIAFLQRDTDTFAFTLIDPTGISGFSMRRIARLLQIQPGEALINFMLEFVRRMIEQQGLRSCLTELFGEDDYDEDLESLSGIDRDDAITEKYCDSLSRNCKFRYVLRASILHPDQDRLYYQLIYATRNPAGIKKFKQAEKNAMQKQDASRARVEAKKDMQRRGGQLSFLNPAEMPESGYYIQLRNRYVSRSRKQIATMINDNASIAYDKLWLCALGFPMVWESDLQGWLKGWLEEKKIEWQGKRSRERIFKLNSGHAIAKLSGPVA